MNTIIRDFERRCEISRLFFSHIENVSDINEMLKLPLFLNQAFTSPFIITLRLPFDVSWKDSMRRYPQHKYQELILELKKKVADYYF